jgi:hypothetical protein
MGGTPAEAAAETSIMSGEHAKQLLLANLFTRLFLLIPSKSQTFKQT